MSMTTSELTIWVEECPDATKRTIKIEHYECGMEFTLDLDELKEFHEMIGEAL